MGVAKPERPWHHIDDKRPGDRTLEQQMTGLDTLMRMVKGKTVLDLGCAEGLIAIEMAKAGAIAVHGVEIRPRAVEDANILRGDLPITFEVGDGNDWAPKRKYDIVAMLSFLHKLRDPTTAVYRFAACTNDVVIKLPQQNQCDLASPVVVDARSGMKKHKIGVAMRRAGFSLYHTESAYLGEWVGYYRRNP
jgi:SAM-dependent methyltransferase